MRSTFLVCILQLVYSSYLLRPERLGQLEPITGFSVHHRGTHLQSLEPSVLRNEKGHIQPYPDELHVNFEAFGQFFSFDVFVDKELFAADAKLLVQGSHQTVNEEIRLTSYRTTTEEGWITVTITPDLLMHAVIALEDDILQVDPIHSHKENLESSHYSLLEQKAFHRMVIFRHSDLQTNDFLCGVVDPANNETILSPLPPTRRLLQLVPFSGCFPGQTSKKTLTISFAADYGFQRKTPVSGLPSAAGAAALIASIVSTVNTVYYPQLSVWLKVLNVLVQAENSTESWNWDKVGKNNCPGSLDDAALGTFSTWQRNIYNSQPSYQTGLWHLLTDCFPPPGIVGLGWVGGLCEPYHGTGISSFSETTWLTVAHEVGHNFGATHAFQLGYGTTGGIMDYGNGKYQGVYQFHPTYNQAEVCAEITKSVNASTCTGCIAQAKCWQTFQPSCGNGVAEPGEACDDGAQNGLSTSCCTSGCALKAGAECAGGECCTSCLFATAATPCGSAGYCNVGVCQDTGCVAGALTYSPCTTQPGNPCKHQCRYQGACSSMGGMTISATGLPFNLSAAWGSICGRAPLATCQAGVCVTAPCSWQPNAWSACSVTCGSGTQTRTSSCRDPTGASVSSTNCSGTAPSSSQACTQPACPTWKSGSWSTCSVTCGSGTQTRSVTCTNSTTGAVIANSYCSGTKPASSQACSQPSCYQWQASTWSTCSVNCGSGTQTRTVFCQLVTTGATVGNTNCSGTAPASSQACTQSCYQWNSTAWSTCSATCGVGTQTRSVFCQRVTTLATVGNGNCTTTAPASSQACSQPSCYQWSSTSWSSCSVTCGSGTQTRSVFCQLTTTGATVGNGNCTETAPASSQACNQSSCSAYQWKLGSWSTCPVTCGNGVATRTVQCVETSTSNPVANSYCSGTVPTSAQACAGACPYAYYGSAWTTCTKTCGGGTQTRTVVCRDTRTGAVSALCVGTRPPTQQACNTAACP